MPTSTRRLALPSRAVRAAALAAAAVVMVLVLGDDGPEPVEVDLATIEPGEARDFGPPPEWPDGDWDDETVELYQGIILSLAADAVPISQIRELGDSGDPRLAWALADLLRFVGPGDATEVVTGSLQTLAPDIELDPFAPWGSAIDHLLAWDIPVPPQYFEMKESLYRQVEPKWGDLFEADADIDWRQVGWGGVGIDDREFGSDDPCRCIPALDEPQVTSADEGDWYPDDAIVFGVEINGETRAYPKNIMEVHEMVNDTLGGRQIAMPYCTLCGSAQVYLTDEVEGAITEEFGDADRPVLRTSGLLIRSNKMMFELQTRSFVDTFTGAATSGPLADAGVVFPQVSVVTSTWAEWKAANPDTTIVAEDGGIGRSYELDPLAGRDDNGPIFPIGDVDPRLPVQEPVLGLITEDGQAIAVHVGAAASVLSGGRERLEVEGFQIRLDGSGIRATRDGDDAGGHQAFWFAWSQFHPDTQIWPNDFQ
ncbi:MAG: DUF3179 domain-containing (seleno)protein [Actinomycetota bacterium]